MAFLLRTIPLTHTPGAPFTEMFVEHVSHARHCSMSLGVYQLVKQTGSLLTEAYRSLGLRANLSGFLPGWGLGEWGREKVWDYRCRGTGMCHGTVPIKGRFRGLKTTGPSPVIPRALLSLSPAAHSILLVLPRAEQSCTWVGGFGNSPKLQPNFHPL